MGRPLSMDLRERAISRVQAGESTRSVVEALGIAPSSVTKWWHRYQATGSVCPGQMARLLKRQGYEVGRKRVRRLMARMGLQAIYQKPKTTVRHAEHRTYPYLLRGLVIDRPNQVWCADITYVPMRRGFLYLVAIMDWFSRKILAWRLSDTMDVEFCIEALEEAMAKHGRPDIFNTDQGSQFTRLRPC